MITWQQEIDQRLEEIKKVKAYETTIKQEQIRLRNLDKVMKQQWFVRKKTNHHQRLAEKLELDEQRKEAMTEQREELKEVRMSALFKMEWQR